jgi:glycerate-2-kinase
MKNIQTEFSRLIENSTSEKYKELRTVLFSAFSKGFQAVMPDRLIQDSVHVNGTQLSISNSHSKQLLTYDLFNFSKVLIIGGGKATAGLVDALLKKIGPIIECYGSINIPKGQESQWGNTIEFISNSGITSKIDIVYASHPIPDNAGIKGTKKIMELTSKASDNTLVIVIISGGGSALMPLPKRPITISSLRKLNEVLLECGANIVEINAIRKHVSDFKGGQLAQTIYPRTALSLILSDVKGDLLDAIASGPTTYDSSSFASAWEIIEKYRIVHIVPESVRVVLRKGVNGLLYETPKQDNPIFQKISNFIIGSASNALLEMKNSLRGDNISELKSISAPELNGEAKQVGIKLVKLLHSLKPENLNAQRAYLISSGETTVSITGEGKGGRNQEMLLGMLHELSENPDLSIKFAIVSMAFDGIEGNSPAAGAIVDSETLGKIQANKLNIAKSLSENNSYTVFKTIGDAIEIGQTGTNVNDIYCLIMDSDEN